MIDDTFVTSHEKLAEFTGQTNKQIRGTLRHLERLGIAAYARAGRYSIVTVCNYELYQGNNGHEGQTQGQSEGQTKGRSEGRARAGSRATCIESVESVEQKSALAFVENPPFETTEPGSTWGDRKEKAKKAKADAPILLPHQEPWFTEAWNEYPRKKNKKQAQQAFRNAVPTPEVFRKVMDGIRSQQDEMLRKDPRYRPHFATWLNGECWNDEPDSASVEQPPLCGQLERPPVRYVEAPDPPRIA
jgi:hypothetical protein